MFAGDIVSVWEDGKLQRRMRVRVVPPRGRPGRHGQLLCA